MKDDVPRFGFPVEYPIIDRWRYVCIPICAGDVNVDGFIGNDFCLLLGSIKIPDLWNDCLNKWAWFIQGIQKVG